MLQSFNMFNIAYLMDNSQGILNINDNYNKNEIIQNKQETFSFLEAQTTLGGIGRIYPKPGKKKKTNNGL
jgi:hypothetical protein